LKLGNPGASDTIPIKLTLWKQVPKVGKTVKLSFISYVYLKSDYFRGSSLSLMITLTETDSQRINDGVILCEGCLNIGHFEADELLRIEGLSHSKMDFIINDVNTNYM
jgi:hypothetical protein